MNRLDRLLAIVLEIQAKRQVRAEDLAATFETSKRTIYRDIEALSESGVPIVAIPGQGYSLMEGYFLPPLTFTSDEAMMLILGAGAVAQQFDEQYREAAQSATQKIITVLPQPLRQEVEYLNSSMQVMVLNSPLMPDTLQKLRRAIIQRRRVRFLYRARYPDTQPSEMSLREADPYALLHIGGAWMLTAYCYLRHDIRHFRLSRMDDLVVLDQRFTRPPDFKIELGGDEERSVVVRALFDHETAPRVLEAPSLYQTAHEDRPEGVLMTFAVRHPDELLNWLLSWGSHVRVLEPESLRVSLVHEAEAVLKQHLTQNS